MCTFFHFQCIITIDKFIEKDISMNIFVTHPDPVKAGKYLDIKRQNKMLVESVQMLSTAIIVNGGEAKYRKTHVNHPCSIWTRKDLRNYLWLESYAFNLASRYEMRTGKIHKSFQMYMDNNLQMKAVELLPNSQKNLSPFVNCTKNFKHIKNVHEAYKLQLLEKWENDVITPRFDGDFEDVQFEFDILL